MNHLSDSIGFAELFVRDIDRLHAEISSFTDESKLWQASGDVTNCAGTLCLHLVGNLNHFIGAQLGATGYVRNREKEFSDRNVSREVLLQQIEQVKPIVSSTLQKISDDVLLKTYPLSNFGENKTTAFVLLLLSGHLNYHLGQINYLRRLL